MEAANVASWRSVLEVSIKDNYERWKILMKNYLLGENLWVVVESDSDLKKHKSKKMNAKALHIIQVSCGPKIFDDIKGYKTAKEAWNYLGSRYGSELKAIPDIEQGVGDDDYSFEYKALYWYVEKGDWTNVKSFINEKNVLFSASASGRTILHVAAITGYVNIVNGLVKVGEDKLLKMQNKEGFTALALAAHCTGNIKVAKCMVEWNDGQISKDLLGMKNFAGEIPLLLAADKGHTEMTRYLYSKTPRNVLNNQDYCNQGLLVERCIKAEIFDVALKILESDPDLLNDSVRYDRGLPGLRELAKMPSVFPSGCQFGFLHRIIYKKKKFQNSSQGCHKINFSGVLLYKWVFNFLLFPIKLLGRLLLGIVYVFLQIFKFLNIFGIRKIYEQKYSHDQVLQILRFFQRSVAMLKNSHLHQASVYDAMLDAAKHGIVEFIKEMREANPDLLWAMDNHKRGIFSHAVLQRQQDVFQLIYTLNGRKDIVKSRKDVFGNNLLHLAAHLGPSSYLNRSRGPALQMQREFQWFKAVEKIVHPKCKEEKNDDDKTPHELFTEEHKELVKDGQKWAKETARSFSLVGTLIITIMFAAAFTVPGGNTQDTGVPIFLNNKVFAVFLIADAISLFTSTTSTLMFIGIMTSRLSEKDFLWLLPSKLLISLIFLFVSVVSMMVAFCAALAIILNSYRAYKRLIIGDIISGIIPVAVLVLSQLRLLYEILESIRSDPTSKIKEKTL